MSAYNKLAHNIAKKQKPVPSSFRVGSTLGGLRMGGSRGRAVPGRRVWNQNAH
jgi:hypothetical protein